MLRPDPISPIYSTQLTLVAIVTLVTLTIISSSPAQSYADYLMPINPVRPYEDSVERLLGNRWGHGTMIYSDLTGVTGESFAVSVWGRDNERKRLTCLELSRHGDAAKL